MLTPKKQKWKEKTYSTRIKKVERKNIFNKNKKSKQVTSVLTPKNQKKLIEKIYSTKIKS